MRNPTLLSLVMASFFKNIGAIFLRPAKKQATIGMKVAMIHYYDIRYYIQADSGASGSPVLNLDGNVVAIHNSKIISNCEIPVEDKNQLQEVRAGALIDNILDRFF